VWRGGGGGRRPRRPRQSFRERLFPSGNNVRVSPGHMRTSAYDVGFFPPQKSDSPPRARPPTPLYRVTDVSTRYSILYNILIYTFPSNKLWKLNCIYTWYVCYVHCTYCSNIYYCNARDVLKAEKLFWTSFIRFCGIKGNYSNTRSYLLVLFPLSFLYFSSRPAPR